jgi:hypothetical protein
LSYHPSPYDESETVTNALAGLGVRHIRDGWNSGGAWATDHFLTDLAPRGIKLHFYCDDSNWQSCAAAKDYLKSAGLVPYLTAVEAPNEPGGWRSDPAMARVWTVELARAIRSDAATSPLPTVCPALADWRNVGKHEAIGDLGANCSFANIHNYLGDYDLNDAQLNLSKRDAGILAPGRPLLSTETGLSNKPCEATQPVWPEYRAAVLLPLVLWEHYRVGIRRTFIYELLDQASSCAFEDGFGLVRIDGSRKPSFHSLQNVIALLSDPGPPLSATELQYRLHGSTDSTHSVLLQKRDGSFWLALWQSQPYGPALGGGRSKPVTVELAGPADVRVYRPDAGLEPRLQRQAVARMTIRVGVSVELLEIRLR